ncbi:hypothetical protein D3C80_1366120 [compost metagenome]
MTSAGALSTKAALDSLPPTRCTSPCRRWISLSRRASSAFLSIRPAIGTSTSISPTSAVALSGASAPSANTVKDSSLASFLSSASFSLRRRWSSLLVFLRNSCRGLPGPMFISPRMLRTPSIRPLSHSMSSSAAASMRASTATGHGCSMMVLPCAPTSGARRCQISSVMNGMNGCARRRATSSTRTRVRRVPRWRSIGAFSSHSTGLDSSRYQSQYWFQMNS